MQTVSAVIPTHLRPNLLKEAIASVGQQTLLPSELLVVDDADDAETRQVVATAAATLPFPVHYVANAAGGVCLSRNCGADASRSTWIAFLDDDDVWHPQFLARLVDLANDSGVQLALSGLLRHVDEQTITPRAQLPGLTKATVLDQPGSMTGSNFLVAREAYRKVGGFDPSVTVFNDWDLFVRLIDADVTYAVDPEPLAEWRFHPGDRIATPSLRRAGGIEFFLKRHGKRMSRTVRRDLETTMLGIRRMHADRLTERMLLGLQLVRAHGPLRILGRVVRR
jgi:glycosyltransferase involved in cell wall biosynthesis